MRKSKFRKGLVLGIIVLFIGASVVPSTGMVEIAGKSTMGRAILYVGGSGPGNYSKIQDAIDNASNGDTVFVYNGTYYEHNIYIYKNYLNLTGENMETTIIDAEGHGQGITVQENYHHNFISGFTVINTTYTGIMITSQTAWSNAHCDFNTISDCIVRDYTGVCGIRIYGARWTCHADYNRIINCEIYNGSTGIQINGLYAYNNSVINCKIYNTSNGMNGGGDNMQNANISGCEIFNNSNYGLHLQSGAIDNVIYHNNLVDNGQNAIDEGTNNIWYSSTLGEGNYYDDYTGEDNNGDGIGDTPYNISGGSNQDLYPLMYPWYPTHPDTVYVDDDYDNSTPGFGYDRFNRIQYGINEVPENGTVYVYAGTYNEYVEIIKTIELHGENRDATIIDGTGILYCLRALSPATNVIITNLTIKNSQSVGVWIGASGSIIDNVTSCWHINDYGFYPRPASNITIKNCLAHNNERGIYDDGTDGLEVYGCTMRNNTNYGMNTNLATTNAYIHHNNFISNGVNAEDVSDGSNLWEYNYYDDYTGEDNNGDGIGDTPYDIEGSAGEQDLHPLMHPFEMYYILNITAPSQVDEDTEFNVTVKSLGGTAIPEAIVEFNDEIKITGLTGTVHFTAPQVGADTYYDIIATKDGYTADTETILVKDVPDEFVSVFMFGRITNLDVTGEYITFNAVNVRIIKFSPFQFTKLTSGEKISIYKDFQGYLGALLGVQFIFALCDADI